MRHFVLSLISAIALVGINTACSTKEAAPASTSSLQGGAHLNVPANSCEIYIRFVRTAPNSHGAGMLKAMVHVPFLGNGEMVKLVGFYGNSVATDLGNASSCHSAPTYDDHNDRFIKWSSSSNARGDYEFGFPVISGSVLSSCPGYGYAWTGAFFVETNLKTYWLNPDMNKNKKFVFDENGWNNIQRFGGASTMSYYNPLSCTR